MRRIGVIGAGAWGTALASVLRGAGHEVALWAREAEVAASINRDHVNKTFLPGIALDPEIRADGEVATVTRDAEILLLAVPAQYLRATCRVLRGVSAPLVVCAKGIETKSGALLSEIVAAEIPEAPLAVLSGPTFAAEVAKGLPTAVTLATRDASLGKMLADELGTRSFRPYLADDVIGAEIGGAIKNVLAIACGIVEGKNLGDNARAALITRGLAEMVRLAVAKGGRAETLTGLSGLGDLVLTCTATQSRNYSLGVALGQGRALREVLGERASVAEGVDSAAAAAALAQRLVIDMPITATVNAILHRGAAIDDAIRALLSRPRKSETGD
ncbi:MAG: NAD(P)H-dependent glycerol-3-phosphate dehydrogenase [Stellaceae bacterium]